VAEEGVSPDPGAVLRELIQLRYGGNTTELARNLAGPDSSKEERDKWRNYVNRWKRLRGEPNQHDPAEEHLERLAQALNEPVDLLRLLWSYDRAVREMLQAQHQIAEAVRNLTR
jgi:hypothetical protein